MGTRSTRVPVAPAAIAVLAVALAAALAEPAAAHAGSLSGSLQSAPVPSWLLVLTGGGIIGASFLFTSLITDHATIREVNGWGAVLPLLEAARKAVAWAVRAAGVVVLGVVVASGLVGPREPIANAAVLVVWAGWWAGYTMSVYLLGNTWPLVNPWRTLAAALAGLQERIQGDRDRAGARAYPARLGAWPSVAGLLGLVWIEVISPVAEEPRLLAGVVLAYTAVTLVGAAVYGVETWFGTVDPVARVFHQYGRLAPLQRTAEGVAVRLPGAALTDGRRPEPADETAFVIALLWATTYDGFVSTPTWNALARAAVGVGVPPLVLYLAAILAGFGLFFAVFRTASRLARRTADSYVTARFIQGWFVPSLLPIAAGYHLAHFLGYFLGLAPALASAVAHPLASPPAIEVLAMPGWFGGLQLAFIVVGHLLAVWVAHAISFDVFPGRLQPIRSQYPFIVVMIFYTMTSMWIVAQPYTSPPYT